MSDFGKEITGEGVNAWCERELLRRGLSEAEAFDSCGRAMVCSGPDKAYLNNVLSEDAVAAGDPSITVLNNFKRASLRGEAFGAMLIGDTEGGKLVFENDAIYTYFRDVVFPLAKDAGKAAAEIRKVESETSRKFVVSMNGHVFTAVCGARKDRIFYTVELPALMVDIPEMIDRLLKNDDIVDINGVAIDKFRQVFHAKGYDAVYRMICLTELRHLRRYARSGLAKAPYDGEAAYRDYLESLELYWLERKETLSRSREAAWQKTRRGYWLEWEKHERPVYNQPMRTRFAARQESLKRWTSKAATPAP